MEALGSVLSMELIKHLRPSQPNLTPHMDATTAWKHWEAWISAEHGTCHTSAPAEDYTNRSTVFNEKHNQS